MRYNSGMNQSEKGGITINLSTGAIIRVLLFIVLLEVLYLLSDLVLIILTSVVVASAIDPAAKRLVKHGIPRIPSVLTIYLMVLVVIIGLFYLVVPFVVNESAGILNALPNYVESIQNAGRLSPTDATQFSNELSQAIPLREFIQSAQEALAGLSGGFWQLVGAIFGGVFGFILIIVLSFYFAIEERGIEAFIKVITPVNHHEYAIDLWRRSQKKIGLWMQGQLILALIVGVLVYLLLALIGVKYAFTLAVLAGVLEIVPIFGPIIAAIPAVLIGFVQGGGGLALLVGSAYVLIQQFENHLIYPLVVKKVVGVPPVLVIVALLVGGKLAGFLGILLAVPLAAALMELTSDIQKKKSIA